MSEQIIPFDKREGYIWYNGELVDWQDAKIHILNHGLHYASSVFEGERVYNGKVFKSMEHNVRFKESARLLDFEIPYGVEELEEAKLAIIAKQGIVDGYVRPVAFRGCEKLTIAAQNNSVHVAIACWTWPPYYSEEGKRKGIKMTFAKYRRPDPACAPVASKAAGLYMICTISKHQAERAGFNEAMMLDHEGYLAEATSANFFMVIDGVLHTPKADRFLNGITRQTVIELAKENDIEVVERRIRPEELADASDAFVTGSAAEITRVALIDDYKFEAHEATLKLIDAYHDLVRNS